MIFKLVIVCTMLIRMCCAKSDCEGGILKCFGEAVGNLTKMYEDTNSDINFNFKVDVSTMNATDIRNLLMSSNASLFSDRIDFVNGETPSRTTIVQLAEVLRNELQKNDVDLTESKLYLKVNNYSTIEVQIFDLVDDDDKEGSNEDKFDNSTLTLNVNVVMKNATVKLMDEKGEKIATNENDDYLYVDLHEKPFFGKDDENKSRLEYETFTKNVMEKLHEVNISGTGKSNKEGFVKWVKDEKEKLVKFDSDAEKMAKLKEHEKWNMEEKEKLLGFDVATVKDTKKKEHMEWRKEEKADLLGFDSDAEEKAKIKEHIEWNNEEKAKLLQFDLDAKEKANKKEHDKWNREEKETLLEFDIEALKKAKLKEHATRNQNKNKQFKNEQDTYSKTRKTNPVELDPREEIQKINVSDYQRLKSNKQNENRQLSEPEMEENTRSREITKKEKMLMKCLKNAHLHKEDGTIVNITKKTPFKQEQYPETEIDSDDNSADEQIKSVTITEQPELILENTPITEQPEIIIESLPITEQAELILEKANSYYENTEKASAEKEEDSPKEIVEEHEQWNKTIREKLKELNIVEEEGIEMEQEDKNKHYKEMEIVTEKEDLHQKDIIVNSDNNLAIATSKVEVEIVTEENKMNYFNLNHNTQNKRQNQKINPKEFQVKQLEEENQSSSDESDEQTEIVLQNRKKSAIKFKANRMDSHNNDINLVSDDENANLREMQVRRQHEENQNRFRELEKRIEEQKELIEKLRRIQQYKEQAMIEKFNKLKLKQLQEDQFTIATESSNDSEKAKEIEEALLLKARLNRDKAKMVYHVVTESITVSPSLEDIKAKEKEEEELNPIDGFYYDIKDDNQTNDYLNIDYLDLFKETTNENVPYTTLPPSLFITHNYRESIVEEQKLDDTAQEIKGLLDVAKDNIGYGSMTPSEQHYSCNTNITKVELADVVFPWLGAVFVRNGTTSAFEYVCDGAVISEKAIVTAAHCLSSEKVGTARQPRDVIVILGKRNQRDMTANEVYKVQDIYVNAYYSVMGSHISHDLAILKLESAIEFNDNVAPACTLDFDLTPEDTIIDAITTGWNDNGDLTAIHFETMHKVQNNTFCLKDYAYQHVFCDTIGFEQQICPSYGGIYAIKLSNHNWYLKGILSADTTKKGICIQRNLRFTNLGESEYKNWLKNVIKM